ncbi:NPCBM/NEW2 domain-containing protein [Streptomyces sp.]|uniref:NPCBM/NEW2 domain-containing protein n=1 Tax=Streptomyces sp. TaxID=1931 RepID=UPI002F3E794A
MTTAAPDNGDTNGAVSQPDVVYLSSLDPIGGLGNWKTTGSAGMGQKTYGNGIIFTPNYFNSQRLDLTFTIPSGMKHFKATVGLDDRTAPGATVFFQIQRNETPVDSGFTLGVDGRQEVNPLITGAHRLTIMVEVTKRAPDSINAPLHAVWGDARFSKQ